MMTIRRRAMAMGRLPARRMMIGAESNGKERPPMAQGRRTMTMATQPPARQWMSAQPPMMIGAASNAEPMKPDEATPTGPAWQRQPVLALQQV